MPAIIGSKIGDLVTAYAQPFRQPDRYIAARCSVRLRRMLGVILAKYFVLAEGTKPLPLANDSPWPYEVALCFEAVPRPVGLAEGVGHGQAGGIFSAQEALAPTWKEHFSNAGGEWLLPFVRELAEGHSVSSAVVIKRYQERHGAEPKTYECNFS